MVPDGYGGSDGAVDGSRSPGGTGAPRMIGSGGPHLGTDPDWLRRVLEGVVEGMVNVRRDIHAHPELSWEEVRTSALVADELVRFSRRMDPRAGVSLVWGKVGAGPVDNVIPERGKASGSVRVLDADVWESADELIPQLIREVAAPIGRTSRSITYEVRHRRSTIPEPLRCSVVRGLASSAQTVMEVSSGPP